MDVQNTNKQICFLSPSPLPASLIAEHMCPGKKQTWTHTPPHISAALCAMQLWWVWFGNTCFLQLILKQGVLELSRHVSRRRWLGSGSPFDCTCPATSCLAQNPPNILSPCTNLMGQGSYIYIYILENVLIKKPCIKGRWWNLMKVSSNLMKARPGG